MNKSSLYLQCSSVGMRQRMRTLLLLLHAPYLNIGSQPCACDIVEPRSTNPIRYRSVHHALSL